jgi:hypothetical protein
MPFVQRDELRTARLHRDDALSVLALAYLHACGCVVCDDR